LKSGLQQPKGTGRWKCQIKNLEHKKKRGERGKGTIGKKGVIHGGMGARVGLAISRGKGYLGEVSKLPGKSHPGKKSGSSNSVENKYPSGSKG